MPTPSHDASGHPTAEAEIKLPLSAEEFIQIPARLPALGFAQGDPQDLCDYYLDYARSPLGGWDFTRLRVSGDDCRLTEKRWAPDAQGVPVRLEDERAITRDETEKLLAVTPSALFLKKRRRNFHGYINAQPATIVLDELTLQGQTRFFIECEVLTTPDRARETRKALLDWTKEKLPVSAVDEAPSMLALILEGLKTGA